MFFISDQGSRLPVNTKWKWGSVSILASVTLNPLWHWHVMYKKASGTISPTWTENDDRNCSIMDITTVGAKRPNLAKLFPLLRYKWHNNVPHASLHKQLVCLPERGLEDLSRGALFGVVVVSVEEVSEHSLVRWNVHCLHAVDSLGAGLRQRQAWPPIWTPLVVFNAPEETGDSRSFRAFILFIRGLISSLFPRTVI